MSINNLLRPSRRQNALSDGTMGTENLRSYQHASRIFLDSNYRLSPKYGFLFYVEFDFNPLISSVSNLMAQELGMIVKSVSLPKFTMDTKVHNAYNRKNIVQNKISYDPVTITFHDDQADNVRNFWYDYYSFYYRDSDFADSTYNIISKYQERPSFSWGYTPRPNASYNTNYGYQNYQYIQAIRIYSLYQKNFSEYELINPVITNFRHGEHQNGDNNLLQHEMSIQFETVKYQTGYTTENNVGGYIDLHYDTTPSPIAPTVGTNIMENGQGGFTNVPDTITDLASQNMLAGSVVQPPISGPLGIVTTAATTAGAGTNLSATATINAGGFTLPYLGSVSGTLNYGAIVNQQLNAAAVSIASQTGSTLAGSVVRGITNGLGTNGTSIVGLAAATLTNPSAVIRTVENMAIKFATGVATSVLNNYTTQAGAYVQKEISSLISDVKAGIVKGLDFEAARGQLLLDPNGTVSEVTLANGQTTYVFLPSSDFSNNNDILGYAQILAEQNPNWTTDQIASELRANYQNLSVTESEQFASGTNVTVGGAIPDPNISIQIDYAIPSGDFVGPPSWAAPGADNINGLV